MNIPCSPQQVYTRNMSNILRRLFGSKLKIASRAYGALPDRVDYRDIPTTAFGPVGFTPAKHMADLTKLDVFDQKQNGSCVGQSLAMVATYYWLKEYNEVDHKSARYLYGLAKKIDGIPHLQGTYPRVAAGVYTNGAASQTSIKDNNDLNHEAFITFPITGATSKEALRARITGYAFTPLHAAGIKNDLANFDVLTASLAVGVWDYTGYCQPPVKITAGTGYHQPVLIGYEEIGNRTKVFFRNSWSKAWGNKGNGWFWLEEYLDLPGAISSVLAYTDVPVALIKDASNLPYKFSLTLRRGSKGREVMELQKRLDIKPADGIFGPGTDKAVRSWQRKNKLTADGIVGKNSRTILNLIVPMPEGTDLLRLVEEKADALIELAYLMGTPIKITDSYRSVVDQEALYWQGRTTEGEIVTNAKGGYSFHNYRVAFDIVFTTPEGGITYEGDWDTIGRIGNILGLEWGGNWVGPDRPHFQLTLGYQVEDFLYGRVDYKKFN